MQMAAVSAVTELEFGCHNMKRQKLATFGLCNADAKPGGTCAETRFRLALKRTSPFKSVGASVQSPSRRDRVPR
jgi:hypothetical protein